MILPWDIVWYSISIIGILDESTVVWFIHQLRGYDCKSDKVSSLECDMMWWGDLDADILRWKTVGFVARMSGHQFRGLQLVACVACQWHVYPLLGIHQLSTLVFFSVRLNPIVYIYIYTWGCCLKTDGPNNWWLVFMRYSIRTVRIDPKIPTPPCSQPDGPQVHVTPACIDSPCLWYRQTTGRGKGAHQGTRSLPVFILPMVIVSERRKYTTRLHLVVLPLNT